MGFWNYGGGGIDPSTPISDLPGDLPASRVTGYKTAAVNVPRLTSYNLAASLTEMSVFRKKLLAPQSGLVMLTWQVDTAHLGVAASSPYGTQYPIIVEGKVCYRAAASEGGLTGGFGDIDESHADGILRDVTHHYQTIGAARVPFVVTAATWYEFSIRLRGTATLGSLVGSGNLATMQHNGGEQYFVMEYEPGAVMEA